MKKSLLLLPLAVALAACSSNAPAPVENAGGSLEPAQPVLNGSNAGWQTDIPSAPMPPSMNNIPPAPPVYQPPVSAPPVVQPVYQPPVATPPAAKSKRQAKKSVQSDFTIPRDDKNMPIYSQIDKGFYDGDHYTVRKGDTMFLIGYITGKDVREIAALNNLSEPYQLRVGQTLKLNNGATASSSKKTASSVSQPVQKPVEPVVTYTPGANGTAYGSDGTVTGPIKAGVGVASMAGQAQPSYGESSVKPTMTATTGHTPAQLPAVSSSVKWQWPTQGRVVSNFSASDGGNKGIDIAGSKGQAVKAAAAGRVVYAGNALQGYGNLIIIKHNDDFLSAYAHNDSIKVDEQDKVSAGETIATLGSTGTNSNKLHFEIRYQGKSVDPMRYLPRQ